MYNGHMEPIIDSAITLEEALQSSPAPLTIRSELVLLTVHYVGFDARHHQGQIVVHSDVADDVRSFFERALALRFPIQSVIPIGDARFNWNDEVSCCANNSSGFNYRTIAGTDELSKHSYGKAFDINPMQNIYIRYKNNQEISRLPKDGIYDETANGTLTTNHPLVTHMKDREWTWGGDWTPKSGRIDYQHFEKITN